MKRKKVVALLHKLKYDTRKIKVVVNTLLHESRSRKTADGKHKDNTDEKDDMECHLPLDSYDQLLKLE
jgi:hypothetical protein